MTAVIPTRSAPPDGTAAAADDAPAVARPARARWERPAAAGLLVATAALYLWGLGESGWANSFYSAAVQAGSVSWSAFLWGASDAAGSITVDKPPASLWVMALSVRLFGLSSWSILVPQALMGVASVWLLYAAVRRHAGAAAALTAGAVLALTPVATLMFRFNNPDALLVLLMTAGAYATVRAVQSGRARWLVLVGVLVGLGFLTKQLQVFLVLPGYAVAWLVAAPVSTWRRIRGLLLAGLAMVLAGGWWVALVELVPSSMRPYVGGSQEDSFLELTLGYNGLGRLTGDEVGSVGGGGGGTGGPGGGGMWGETGLWRMFSSDIGGQIAWLLPAALVLLVAGVVLRGRAPRTDVTRAALVVWGSWLLVTTVTFSFMGGIFHQYYTVALAPAIAALVAIGGAQLWRHSTWWSSALMAATVAGSAVWAWVLLDRSPDWLPWLKWAVVAAGTLAALGLLVRPVLRRAAPAFAVVALAALLAGPAAYSLETAATPHTGSIVTAGPAVAGGPGAGGGPGGVPGGMPGGMPGGAPGGVPAGAQGPGPAQDGTAGPGGTPPGMQGTAGTQGGPQAGGMGGLLEGSTPSQELTAALLEDAGEYTWVAAAVGSQNASGYQLATEEPVMAIGGFNGSDPSPTLAEFQEYVADGEIHYFLGGGGFGQQNGGSSASSEITAWVEENFMATTVDGVVVYDLTTPQA